jgi:hypothetical protein
MMKYLVGVAAALALLAATPAAACGDCKDCPGHKKEAAAAAATSTAVADAEKKDSKTCGCDHSASKECKCGEKCQCANCPVHGKDAKKGDKKT